MVVNSTTDIVNALVAKGVLTEEEGALLNKGREGEAAGQAKAMKKASKLKVSDAIDNATIYGDVRVRYEDRSGTGVAGSTAPQAGIGETRGRARYKVTLGAKTEAGNWYSDIALAMGANGRSDNATFGTNGNDGNMNKKEIAYIKRAMVGYKATDWLTVQAGRMENPLYTTPMVWDADLTVEGFSEQVKYKIGDNLELFGTALQSQYQGDRKTFDQPNTAKASNTFETELFAFQGGAKYNLSDRASAKAALTYSFIGNNTSATKFAPGLGTDGSGVAAVTGVNGVLGATVNGVAGTGFKQGVAPVTAVSGYQISAYGTNDLATIEIPAEINFMATSNIGIRAYGDYVWNTSADDRAKHSGLSSAANGSSGSDDTAWLLGVVVGSAKDLKAFEGNKMAKGDWSARLWYQDVGVWSVDANAVDSDFMDSRVNMAGTTFKAKYNIEDNIIADFAYGHATRKNNAYGSAGSATDLALNLDKFDLLQFDITYKF